MPGINEMIRRVEAIDVTQVVREAIEDTKEQLIQKQRQQMYAGKRSDGKDIDPLHGRYKGYAQRTRAIKRAKGQLYRNVTLKDEGDFYNEIFVDTRDTSVVFGSADSKTQILVDYYGPEIFGVYGKFAAEYSKINMGPVATRIFKARMANR